MSEINHPFSYKVSRNFLSSERQPENVGNLRSEDGDGNTACKTYDDGIGDKLNDSSQLEHSQQDEQYACHQCGDNKPRFTVLLDDAIDNDDERTGRSSMNSSLEKFFKAVYSFGLNPNAFIIIYFFIRFFIQNVMYILQIACKSR